MLKVAEANSGLGVKDSYNHSSLGFLSVITGLTLNLCLTLKIMNIRNKKKIILVVIKDYESAFDAVTLIQIP